jgi:phage tail-like protein
MNSNGLRFWDLSNASDWLAPQSSALLEYTDARRLRLKSTRQSLAPKEDEVQATMQAQAVPHARDMLGGSAYLDPATQQIMVTGGAPGTISVFTPQAGDKITDFALGFDGIFYIAVNGALLLQDRRGRWGDFTLKLQGFNVFRLAADPAGGIWVLNGERTQLARMQGLPLPEVPQKDTAPGVMRPCDDNTDPPRLTKVIALPSENFVALSTSPSGRVALLSWNGSQGARVRLLTSDCKMGAPQALMAGTTDAKTPVKFPYSVAFVDEDNLAVLVTGLHEVLVYKLEDLPELFPVGDMYPLAGYTDGPFLHGLDFPPHYPTSLTSSAPLYPISYRSFAKNAGTFSQRVIDSQQRQTEWHRIYMEAVIPAHCGIRIFLAASDRPEALQDDKTPWFEHRFGQMFASAPDLSIPTGAWVRYPSELPFHDGVLGCPLEKNKSGLFTVLVQRAGLRVRSLRGRYLGVRIELMGDGLSTPEVASLRIYGSRFSFVKNYLPELYQESVFGSEADQGKPNTADQASTPADFLERFVDNFEGVLTEVEDRVASSYLLTRPESIDEDALPWLANWIGLRFDPAYPKDRRRQMLQEAPGLFENRGTLRGLQQALDVATGGMCSNGSIIVIEEFRLRRTFATILGANLADEHDPLLPGFGASGNSFVGDTLFLGEEHHKEFLALFGARALQGLGARDRAEAEKAIHDFYATLAHRVTVLVHNQIQQQDFGLIRRVVELEKPAHVLASVQTATCQFLVGIAALLGVDTYLTHKPEPKPVRVDKSFIGGTDLIRQIPSLDPRFEGASANPYFGGVGGTQVVRVQSVQVEEPQPKPLARVDAPKVVRPGDSISLDATTSEAPLGKRIVKYRWTLIQ